MFKPRLSFSDKVSRDRLSARARSLTRRREQALRRQVLTWARTARPIIGGAPGTPARGGGTLPVLREPAQPHHLTLQQASILTCIPVGVLKQEAKAGRIPGAYDAGNVLHFDPHILVGWVGTFWATDRSARLRSRVEVERSLTVAEVADALRCDDSYVRRLLRQGELHGLKLGRAVRIWETSLEAYREGHAYQATREASRARQVIVRQQTKKHDAAVRRLGDLLA